MNHSQGGATNKERRELAVGLDAAACIADFRAMVDAILLAIGDSPARAAKAHAFLFDDVEELSPELFQFRGATAPRTNIVTLTLEVSDALREFTVALAAGKWDACIIDGESHG